VFRLISTKLSEFALIAVLIGIGIVCFLVFFIMTLIHLGLFLYEIMSVGSYGG
jgi:hypothetical protein